MRKYLLTIAGLLLITATLPCISLAATKKATATVEHPRLLMKTNYGDITIELFPNKAPKTVANFLRYVDEGFYEYTLFHRVLRDFMIQAGGFTMDYQKKPTHKNIPNEADNGLRNTVGTLAMARTRDPHSAASQFFINTVNNPHLDFTAKTPEGWGYCVFGKVIKGMDVVMDINKVVTGPAGPWNLDAPQGMILIEKITRLTNTQQAISTRPAKSKTTLSQ